MILSPYCGNNQFSVTQLIDIKDSVKYGEITRSQKATAIDVIIEKDNQPLPETMESFRASSPNKENLQMFFINWLIKYLGRSLPGDLTAVSKLLVEAEERILFHINHAIKTEHYRKIMAAATDTNIFISLLHYYQQ